MLGGRCLSRSELKEDARLIGKASNLLSSGLFFPPDIAHPLPGQNVQKSAREVWPGWVSLAGRLEGRALAEPVLTVHRDIADTASHEVGRTALSWPFPGLDSRLLETSIQTRESIEMAKPLGEKSRLIRQAIADHPDMGNTALAEMLNKKHAMLDIKAPDVGNQRTALKKLSAGPAVEEEEEDFEDPSFTKAPPPAPTKAHQPPSVPAASGLTVDDLATLRSLVAKAGGVEVLIKWLETIREMR
jgi:hypothetical protein